MKSYIFNHDYVLRHDQKRTYIIQIYANNSELRDWVTVLHPVQAMILSFFSKPKPYNNILKEIATFLDISVDETIRIITPFLENKEDVYTEYDGHKFTFPNNILIETSKNKSPITEYKVEEFFYNETDFISKRYYTAPLNITFMPSNTCFTDCIYCYADKNSKTGKILSLERLKEIIDEAKSLHIMRFNLVGGEVFTFPKWLELISYIKKNNFFMDRLSTKFPLKEKDISNLKNIGINQIQISLDTLLPVASCQILGTTPEYIEKIKKTICLLSEYGFDITVTSILLPINCNMNDMYSIYNFIKTIPGITSWSLRPAFPSIYKPASESFIPSKKQIDNLFEEMEHLKAESKINIDFDKTFLNRGYVSVEGGSKNFNGAECSSNRSHIFVLPDGKVTICEQLYWKPHFIVGDLTHQSIKEVWNSEKSLWFYNLKTSQLSDSNPCKKCEIFNECYRNMNRCWAEVIKAYGDEHWDYPDPRCRLAPEMKNNLIYS
jgi:radical SAM protein with 4Fe4S-binding SPASM domain